MIQVEEGQLLSPGRSVGGAHARAHAHAVHMCMRCTCGALVHARVHAQARPATTCGALAVPMLFVSGSLSRGSHFLRSTMITVSSMSRYWWGKRVEIGFG